MPRKMRLWYENPQVEKWLKSLKAGDEVAIERGSYAGRSGYLLSTVVAVTPVGYIDIKNPYHGITPTVRFRPDGTEARKGDGWSAKDRLVEPTDAVREEMERAGLLAKITVTSREKWALLTVEELRKVHGCITAAERRKVVAEEKA